MLPGPVQYQAQDLTPNQVTTEPTGDTKEATKGMEITHMRQETALMRYWMSNSHGAEGRNEMAQGRRPTEPTAVRQRESLALRAIPTYRDT